MRRPASLHDPESGGRNHSGSGECPCRGRGHKNGPGLQRDDVLVVNLSGRGDKDMETVARLLEGGGA